MPLPASLHLQLSGIVAEREQGLRQALKTMGMLESGGCGARGGAGGPVEQPPAPWSGAVLLLSLAFAVSPRPSPSHHPLIAPCAPHPAAPTSAAFWLSWLAVEVLAAVLFALLLIAFGAMFQFQFFLINSFGLVRGATGSAVAV